MSDSTAPLVPRGASFDQLLKRFFEQPFQFRNPAEKNVALGCGFIINRADYIVTDNLPVANAEGAGKSATGGPSIGLGVEPPPVDRRSRQELNVPKGRGRGRCRPRREQESRPRAGDFRR